MNTLWLVNGQSTGVDPADRGLAYGDGLFETMAANDGHIRWLDLHLDRLEEGCRRLEIPAPSRSLVAREIEARCPEAIVLVVSNPLDVMSYVMLKTTGFDRKRVIGMAGVLDTARFRSFIALELDVSVRDVSAFVLGGHGDSMVPLPRYSTVAGIPIPHLLSEDRIEALVDRTRKGGGEIVELLGSGSAFYAPSAAVVEMAEAIIRDRNRILPCAAWLQGEYGLSDVFVGVPVKLGAGGIKEIVEIELTGEEKKALHASAAHVKETMSKLDL